MPFNMLITLSGPFYDESEHIKLTHISSAIALFLCLLDYYTLTIRFCFIPLE